LQPLPEISNGFYKKGSFETYLGKGGLARLGKKKWRRHVDFAVSRLVSALELDDVVIGGGNAKLLNHFPPKCREGSNANAFIGGFRLWENSEVLKPATAHV